ncbi:MAG: alpha/beta hydrolase family protein [Clostridiaceae bacterium]
MSKYYTTQPHFEKMFETTFRTHTFKAETVDEFTAWKQSLTKKLWELTGMNRMVKCDFQPQMLEEVKCDGYIRRKMLINTEPDVIASFYLLIPDNLGLGERRTAVIASHGHSSNGKEAVAGVRSSQAMAKTIDHYNYNYGEVLAQKGYIVLCPDARGFGERRERYYQGDSPEQIMGSSCDYLNVMAMSFGQTVTGMWTWDLMRLVDYVLTRDDVNGHVASVGLSGGGLQSLWLSALDERIECSVVSGYFYGYLESLLIRFNCLCNYVPHLWSTVDIGDIGALIAPRPLLIETGDQDDLNGQSGLLNVTTQIKTVQRAMDLTGKPGNIYHDIFSGGHRWHGEYAYRWLLKHCPPAERE